MYYLGVMQWVIKHFAWLFFKIMNVSGAEAVVAAASPWIGQGESACLVRPYVDCASENNPLRFEQSLTESRSNDRVRDPSYHDLWILDHRRIRVGCLHWSWCSCREPCYLLGDEYSCFHGHQQDALPRARRACHSWTCYCRPWRIQGETTGEVGCLVKEIWADTVLLPRQTHSTLSAKVQSSV